MTSNQIAFRNYEETVRHNREMERLTGEQQAEVAQHNRATEFNAAIEVGEKQRSNRANESIERQRNAINDTHYLRQDTMTGFKYGVDAYVSTYPIKSGKVDAETGKLIAEANYTNEKTKSEPYNRGKTISETFYTNAKTKTEGANYLNVLFDNSLKGAQTEKVKSEIDLMYPNSEATRFSQYTQGAANIGKTIESGTRSVGNVINAVKTVSNMLPKSSPISYVRSILLD